MKQERNTVKKKKDHLVNKDWNLNVLGFKLTFKKNEEPFIYSTNTLNAYYVLGTGLGINEMKSLALW